MGLYSDLSEQFARDYTLKIFATGVCNITRYIELFETSNVDIIPETSILFIGVNEVHKAGSYFYRSILEMDEKEKKTIVSLFKNHLLEDYETKLVSDKYDYVVLSISDDVRYDVSVHKETNRCFCIRPSSMMNEPANWDSNKCFGVVEQAEYFNQLFSSKEVNKEDIESNLMYIIEKINELGNNTRIVLCKHPLLADSIGRVISLSQYSRSVALNDVIDSISSKFDNVLVWDFGKVICSVSQSVGMVSHNDHSTDLSNVIEFYNLLANSKKPSTEEYIFVKNPELVDDLTYYSLKAAGVNIIGQMTYDESFHINVEKNFSFENTKFIFQDDTLSGRAIIKSFNLKKENCILLQKEYFREVKKYAELGENNSQIVLSDMYMSNNKKLLNPEIAFFWAKKASKQSLIGKLKYVHIAITQRIKEDKDEIVNACINLASNGVERGIAYFKMAYRSRYNEYINTVSGSDSQFLVSTLLETKNEPFWKDAMRICEKSDDCFVMLVKSELYRLGKGVPANNNEAIKVVEQIASKSQGLILYECYDQVRKINSIANRGLLNEIVEKMKLIKSANCFARVGRAYRDGAGVDLDLELSRYWMKKAVVLNEIEWPKWEFFQILWNINTSDSLREMIEFASNESNKGNTELKGRLARAYRDGKGVISNNDIAITLLRSIQTGVPVWAKWELFDLLWKKADCNADVEMIALAKTYAEAGERELQARLARAYRDGRGVEQSYQKASEWMRKAADNNLPWAKWELFDILWKWGTSDADVEMIALAKTYAEAGERELQARLARAYRDGRGVEQSYQKASEWMRKAADNNLPWAKWELFDILWKWGTPQALDYMINYATSESNHGNMELRARLGRAYRDGKGVNKDLHKAAMLMKDTHGGNPQWSKWEYVDILYSFNDKESDKEAFEFALPYAKEGQRDLQAWVGRMYRDGRGVKKDLNCAIEWMSRASNQNLGWATNELIDLLLSVNDTVYDKRAFLIAKDAAQKGNGGAMRRLARCYWFGRGIDKSLPDAEKWMNKASELDIRWAKQELQEILIEKNSD